MMNETEKKQNRVAVKGGMPFLLFGLSLFIALCAYRVMLCIHDGHWQYLTDAVLSVLSGTPPWRAFENRQFCPRIIGALGRTGMGGINAYKLFLLLSLCAQSLLLCGAVYRIRRSAPVALFATVGWAFLFCALQHAWAYPWDLVEGIAFTMFGAAVLFRNTVPVIAGIFLFAIVNRESALFCALYLILDGLHNLRKRQKDDQRPGTSEPHEQNEGPASAPGKAVVRIVAGCLLFAAGVVYTKMVRDLFFAHSSFSFIGADEGHRLLGNHIIILDNLRDIVTLRLGFIGAINAMLFAAAFAASATLFRFVKRSLRPLVAVLCCMAAAPAVFSQINEPRNLIGVVPLILLLWCEALPQR